MRINKAKSCFYEETIAKTLLEMPGETEEKHKSTILEMEKEQTYRGCRD